MCGFIYKIYQYMEVLSIENDKKTEYVEITQKKDRKLEFIRFVFVIILKFDREIIEKKN